MADVVTPLSEYGSEWRIFIGDGGAGEGGETFYQIGGETQFDWTRQSDSIDLSSKDDGVYKAQGFGQQTVSFKLQGKLKLPDPGLQRLSDVSKMSPPNANMKVMKGAISKYLGAVGFGNFSTSFVNNDAATYSCDATAVAAPTTDALGAAA